MRTLADPLELVTPGDLGDEQASFLRALRAENASPNTVSVYGSAIRDFGRWLLATERPTDVEAITLEDIQAWIGDLLATRKPATAHNRWRALQRFLNWYTSKSEHYRSPLLGQKPPRLPKGEPRVLTIDELRAIVGACRGGSFEDRRDEAIVRVLFDAGARRTEVANLRYSPTDPADRSVDLRRGVVTVHGKGDKTWRIGLSDRTIVAMEDYLRIRRKHPHADEPWLWLGRRGRVTSSGLYQIIEKRGLMAGIPDLHPHDFRHAATHHELVGGMNQADVMNKRGWESPAMLRRYAATTATERAITATKRLGLGDKL